MKAATAMRLALAAVVLVGFGAWHWAFGNGGPFVVKSPTGDLAAKGVLARLDPTLKPARESRLRVVKEDLTITFAVDQNMMSRSKMPPLVNVKAEYLIENPTEKEVQIDFGFPILRGIYLNPSGMMPWPDVYINIDKPRFDSNGVVGVIVPTVISNSTIYGLIRRNARQVIEKGIAADKELARLTTALRGAWIVPQPPASVQKPPSQSAKPSKKGLFSDDLDIPFTQETKPGSKEKVDRRPSGDYIPARENLRKYLTDKLSWNPRDAALMVEYVSLDIGPQTKLTDPDLVHFFRMLLDVAVGNLGPLTAIGEQKATQLFAQLASKFDKEAGAAYEAIFTAWGGDVRERSIDMESGKLRPRELTLDKTKPDFKDRRLTAADPTVYARVDYLDPNAKISKEEKDSCRAILKNLPVVFTFAPMNLLHYQVKFPPHAKRTVTVMYKQYAYADTRGSGSYQLAYVLHPATLWNDFGPINVELHVPTGITCRSSAAIKGPEMTAQQQPQQPPTLESIASGKKRPASNAKKPAAKPGQPIMEVYKAVLTKPEQKSGELFVAVDKAAWDKMFPPKNEAAQ